MAYGNLNKKKGRFGYTFLLSLFWGKSIIPDKPQALHLPPEQRKERQKEKIRLPFFLRLIYLPELLTGSKRILALL
ncbi:hypothetical protein BH24BAC1_BH24BAC1_32680 [soil metagenome]